ncbi:hypothetical protein AVEN_267235-1, partial [Araneus ventricosus]
ILRSVTYCGSVAPSSQVVEELKASETEITR